MTGRIVVTGVVLVILVALAVTMVEFFLPLSAKSDMNLCCRRTLVKMEVNGGLATADELELTSELTDRGFTNIDVLGTSSARQGGGLRLRIEADYEYSKLTGIFSRTGIMQHMIYDKMCTARKVVN